MRLMQRAAPGGPSSGGERVVAVRGIAMRDPELVFKAQLAGSALERAWQRWRVMHGLIADPMPAISSYVGYSLEEPWGQPRVVFGLSAKDAEQLSALLNRHDCIGPVHAKFAGQQEADGRQQGEPAQPGEQHQQGDRRADLRQLAEPGPQGRMPGDPDSDNESQNRGSGARRGWIAPPGRGPGPAVRDSGPLGPRWVGPHGSDTGPLGRDAGPMNAEIAQLGRDAGPHGRGPGPRGKQAGPQGADRASRGQDAGSQAREHGPHGREQGQEGREHGSQRREMGQQDRERGAQPGQGPGTRPRDHTHPYGPDLPLPVPPQAPYFIAEQSSSDDRSPWRTWRSGNAPDEMDGPVYREIARAAREAAESNDDGLTERPSDEDGADQASADQASANQARTDRQSADQGVADGDTGGPASASKTLEHGADAQPPAGEATSETAAKPAAAEPSTDEPADQVTSAPAVGETNGGHASGKSASTAAGAGTPTVPKPGAGTPTEPKSGAGTSSEPKSGAGTSSEPKSGAGAPTEAKSGGTPTEPKSGAGTSTQPKVPAQPTARPGAKDATSGVEGDAKIKAASGEKSTPPLARPVSPGSAGAEPAKAAPRPAETPGNTGKPGPAPAEAAAAARQPEARSTAPATVTGARPAADRPHAGPARKDQPARAGAVRPAKKRPKPQAGSARDTSSHPEGSSQRGTASRDDSDDGHRAPGGGGDARMAPSKSAARNPARTNSGAATSDPGSEANLARSDGRTKPRDEAKQDRPGKAQDAATRAVDAWADEIVRSSHGSKGSGGSPRGAGDAAGRSGSSENSTARIADPEAVDAYPDGLFDEDDDGPGPLTLAASAARIEAEARIRAAMMRASLTETRESDSESESDEAGYDVSDSKQAGSAAAESGDEGRPEIAAAWGGPALSLRQVHQSGRQGGSSEETDYADEDDQDPPEEDRSARSLSSYVRRSRIARGYSIPRLSKSKR